MKKTIANIFRNPKTSIAALVVGVLTAVQQLGYIDQDTYVQFLGVAATLGFVVSKDDSTSGVAKEW